MGVRRISRGIGSEAQRSTRVTVAVAAVCLVLVVVCVGAVVGKYQHLFQSDDVVRAQEFYFTSNLLDGETHTLAPGSTSVTFTLGNHADELRYSEVDIIYNVTVERASNDIEGSGGDTTNPASVTYNNASKTLKKRTQQDDTVTILGLQPGTYTVTATGTGQQTQGNSTTENYQETLTATVEVSSTQENLFYNVEATGDYVLLTVWNEGDEAGNVAITYTGIPDNTNPNMGDWVTGGNSENRKQNVTLEPHESKVFRFFGDAQVKQVTNAKTKSLN